MRCGSGARSEGSGARSRPHPAEPCAGGEARSVAQRAATTGGSDLYYMLRSVARPLRIEYPGAVYYVASRGKDRSSIFRDDEDRKSFLQILRSVAADQGWLVHAYCLMANRYHLLLETPAANLTLGMRSLNSRYGQRFNLRHGRSGLVLEGRYKAVLVQKDSHLLELHRYVVLHPVRARLVPRPGEWPWSNYRATSGRAAVPPWLEVDWTLSQFGLRRGVAEEAYRRFVLAGKGLPSPLEDVKGQIYLGEKRFVKAVAKQLPRPSDGDQIQLRQPRPWQVSLESVRRSVAREFGVSVEALSWMRGGEEKMAAIYLARKLTGLSGRGVASAFGVKEARVSNVLREIEEGGRKRLRARVERLRVALVRRGAGPS